MTLNRYAAGPQFDYFVAWRYLLSARYRHAIHQQWQAKGGWSVGVDIFLGLGSFVLSTALLILLGLMLWWMLAGGV